MEFTMEMARDFLAVAERVGGTAEVNSQGQLVIRLSGLFGPANIIAETITDEEFPYGYITAEDDSTLIFRS